MATETVLTDLKIRKFDSVGQMNQHESDIGENDLVFTDDTSIRLPILTPMFFDHQANDESWLRADTFSWHSGDVYKSAYEHLVADIDGKTAEEEIVGNTTVSFYRADDGHKICLPDQESNLIALYESTGVAWYYMLDQTNQQFKLPRTKWGFTGLRDSVGGYVAPGLPNITGAFQADNAGFGNTAAWGAFRTETSTSAKVRTTGDNSCNPRVSFNASLSSSIYGKSSTVQPPATQMYLYFYVGTFSQTATEQTAGLNAEMFNDLNAHRVVETQMPTANNGYTWYRKYADGWVEQGGCVTTISTAGNATSVTFAIPMADTSYSAVGSRVVRATSGNGYQTGVAFSVYTTTGMKVHSGVASCTIAWQDRGMAV